MGKYQNVSFQSIEEFLDYLPENERVVVNFLRELILDCLPNCKEKLSYNVPFYSINKRICYIWPGSVLWGKKEKKGVELGFCTGYLLYDELNYLDKGNRKEVYSKRYSRIQDIDIDVVKMLLFNAMEVDTSFKK